MQIILPADFDIYYDARLPFSYPENQNVLNVAHVIKALHFCGVDLGIQNIEIYFRNIKNFTSAASTVLLAHIHHLQRIANTQFSFRVDRRAPVYRQLALFIKAANANTEQKLLTLENNFHPWQSGHSANDKLDSIIEYFNHLRNELKLGENGRTTLSLLQTAIYEALMNVLDHAYLGERAYLEKRWWQMLWLSKSSHTQKTLVNFLIYDLGVGIVQSYQHHNEKGVSPILSSEDDIFRDAMKLGNSRSGEIERGNGLHEMLRPLEQKQVGLWMYSNNVILRKAPVHNIDDCHKVPFSFPGTLIEWTFSLE